MDILLKRLDGSFVVNLIDGPEDVLPDNPLYHFVDLAAQAMGGQLRIELPPELVQRAQIEEEPEPLLVAEPEPPKVLRKRRDGTFVIEVDGEEYHAIPGERYWDTTVAEAERLGDALEFEPEPPPPSPEQVLAGYSATIDAHVEAVARAKGYNGAVALMTYVGSKRSVWAEDAAMFGDWRDDVWTYSTDELAAVQAGTKPIPSIDDFLAALPPPPWPI